MYKAIPCSCGHPVCKNWLVDPVAAFQGVSFTQEQAEAVAVLLNAMATLPGDKVPHQYPTKPATRNEVFQCLLRGLRREFTDETVEVQTPSLNRVARVRVAMDRGFKYYRIQLVEEV